MQDEPAGWLPEPRLQPHPVWGTGVSVKGADAAAVSLRSRSARGDLEDYPSPTLPQPDATASPRSRAGAAAETSASTAAHWPVHGASAFGSGHSSGARSEAEEYQRDAMAPPRTTRVRTAGTSGSAAAHSAAAHWQPHPAAVYGADREEYQPDATSTPRSPGGMAAGAGRSTPDRWQPHPAAALGAAHGASGLTGAGVGGSAAELRRQAHPAPAFLTAHGSAGSAGDPGGGGDAAARWRKRSMAPPGVADVAAGRLNDGGARAGGRLGGSTADDAIEPPIEPATGGSDHWAARAGGHPGGSVTDAATETEWGEPASGSSAGWAKRDEGHLGGGMAGDASQSLDEPAVGRLDTGAERAGWHVSGGMAEAANQPRNKSDSNAHPRRAGAVSGGSTMAGSASKPLGDEAVGSWEMRAGMLLGGSSAHAAGAATAGSGALGDAGPLDGPEKPPPGGLGTEPGQKSWEDDADLGYEVGLELGSRVDTGLARGAGTAHGAAQHSWEQAATGTSQAQAATQRAKRHPDPDPAVDRQQDDGEGVALQDRGGSGGTSAGGAQVLAVAAAHRPDPVHDSTSDGNEASVASGEAAGGWQAEGALDRDMPQDLPQNTGQYPDPDPRLGADGKGMAAASTGDELSLVRGALRHPKPDPMLDAVFEEGLAAEEAVGAATAAQEAAARAAAAEHAAARETPEREPGTYAVADLNLSPMLNPSWNKVGSAAAATAAQQALASARMPGRPASGAASNRSDDEAAWREAGGAPGSREEEQSPAMATAAERALANTRVLGRLAGGAAYSVSAAEASRAAATLAPGGSMGGQGSMAQSAPAAAFPGNAAVAADGERDLDPGGPDPYTAAGESVPGRRPYPRLDVEGARLDVEGADANVLLDPPELWSGRGENSRRRALVKAAARHTWAGYVLYAFGRDELAPLSRALRSPALTYLDQDLRVGGCVRHAPGPVDLVPPSRALPPCAVDLRLPTECRVVEDRVVTSVRKCLCKECSLASRLKRLQRLQVGSGKHGEEERTTLPTLL